MGFFRRLFGAKKKSRSSKTTPSLSQSNKADQVLLSTTPYDANKHAIAVAAATAAVAEAALAAAQAAAEVVRLTGGGNVNAASHHRLADEVSAVKIQSAFRGYLARRALRALKALVKLQALVRGHIVRKQTADMLRRMQTLVRLQARARASRSHGSDSWHTTSKSSHSRYAGNWLCSISSHISPLRTVYAIQVHASPSKDHLFRASSTKFDGPSILKRCGSNANFRESIDFDKLKSGSNWLDRWMEESLWNDHGSNPLRNRHADDEKSDKILEVDTWKPHVKYQQSNRTFQTSQHALASDHNNQSFMTFDSPSKITKKASNPMPSIPSGEILHSLKLPIGNDEAVSRTAENSPCLFSATSRPGSSGRKGGGHFTPTRSECSWGFFNGYAGYPNYMSNTESSRAKVRSQSAPRQRLEFEKYSRRSVQGYCDADTRSERGFAQNTEPQNKAYVASGYSNRIGTSYLRT
ncbi:hypothetical protein SADUNF_Sadunf15G0119100 [Salix dunnii]|uniref:DUF4005 domain-containing protein n=1 Tax=Salix dunnii TaxID=1413687 RepID=A0A835MPA2_9ROSI|nr:hypothetical protein SADUNF_Sadunf15G0119100 [Salix dunnii]